MKKKITLLLLSVTWTICSLTAQNTYKLADFENGQDDCFTGSASNPGGTNQGISKSVVNNPSPDGLNRSSEVLQINVPLLTIGAYGVVFTNGDSTPIPIGTGAGKYRYLHLKLLKKKNSDIEWQFRDSNGNGKGYCTVSVPKSDVWQYIVMDLMSTSDCNIPVEINKGTLFYGFMLCLDKDATIRSSFTAYIDDIYLSDSPDKMINAPIIDDWKLVYESNNGNVGIGTESPLTKLDVHGDVHLPIGNSYWIGSYTDSGSRLKIHHSGNYAFIDYEPQLRIRAGVTNVASFYDNGDVKIGATSFYNNGDVKMGTTSFFNNGNVGIGIANLSGLDCKLTVNGDIQVGLNRGSSNVPIGYANKIDFGGSENLDNIWISRYNVASDVSELRANIGDDGQATDRFAVGYTSWVDNNWHESFAVLANGNVGVGIPNPTVKLDVNGIIRATDVKICLNQGCDYVFEEDYKLMNLNDLSRFVKTNKHLPEVDPAAIMEREGIQVSEMNALLLKKVEELTLYLIQQQETINELKTEIKDLKNK